MRGIRVPVPVSYVPFVPEAHGSVLWGDQPPACRTYQRHSAACSRPPCTVRTPYAHQTWAPPIVPPIVPWHPRWPELGGLGALEELNLAANKISVIPDAAFAGLSSLKILSINDNRLVRLGSLKPLKLLEELRLYNNNLEEMPDIGMMPRLTVLELNKNLIAAIPSGYFANTPAIEKLILSANLLAVVPASLASCVSLQFLQLQDNKLKSFEEAGWHELVQLETLFLQGNPALTVPASLGRCAALKRINVPSATNKLDGTFRMLALSTPGGKYWDKKGKAIETPMH